VSRYQDLASSSADKFRVADHPAVIALRSTLKRRVRQRKLDYPCGEVHDLARAVQFFAISTVHDLSADRHNDPWKFHVVGVDDDGPLHWTNVDFFGD